MGGGEGEDEAGMVTRSIEEEDGGVHGEAILVAMPVRRAAQRRTSFVWTARPLRLDRSFAGLFPIWAPSSGPSKPWLGHRLHLFLN